jgi:predicted patatin/cPLA2 family phospholipase
MNSGSYITWTEKTTKDFVKSIISSTTIPAVFPPEVWPEENYVIIDGGVTGWNTDIVKAVERCREQVSSDN